MTEHPIRTIRRAGVPLAALETADPALTISGALRALNGKAETIAVMSWDLVRGLTGENALGRQTAQQIAPDGPMLTSNPSECFSLLAKSAPEDSLIFAHNAHRVIGSETVSQALWLCRDALKARHATLVLLAPAFTLPDELKHDVVVISEPLPNAADIEAIVRSICEDAAIDANSVSDLPKITESLMGLSGFAAEQALAMSISKSGIDLQSVLERRRAFVAQTSGMEIRTDAIRFRDIAGYETVKTAISRKLAGKRPPSLILWLDEIEKAFAGNAGDMSGTTQDQVGTLLTWMQDRLNADQLSAMLLVGFPGTGKSAVAMATHNEAQCESVRLDMGGMKGSLVGESERKVRQVLKTIDAMSKGHILLVSTCNSVQGLPSPFISRHAFGTYFFDLPERAENAALWALKKSKYDLPSNDPEPESTGWTGREIQQCAFLASDLNIHLREASAYIAPFCRSGRTEIETLRNQAAGRWISASRPGLYQLPEVATGRKFAD